MVTGHERAAEPTAIESSAQNIPRTIAQVSRVSERIRGSCPSRGGVFNGRHRDEVLNGWQFDSLLEAQVLIEDWGIDYNEHRPHSAHSDLTPSEFATAWTTRYQSALA